MLRQRTHSFNLAVRTYVFRPFAVAGFSVLIALQWTFPLQPLMAYSATSPGRRPGQFRVSRDLTNVGFMAVYGASI